MSKFVLMSFVIVPVLLAMHAAGVRTRGRMVLLLASVLTFDVFFMLMLYVLRAEWLDGVSIP